MLRRQAHWQEDLFVAGPLCDLIPDDHVLKGFDKLLDLSWLREGLRELYKEHARRHEAPHLPPHDMPDARHPLAPA